MVTTEAELEDSEMSRMSFRYTVASTIDVGIRALKMTLVKSKTLAVRPSGSDLPP